MAAILLTARQLIIAGGFAVAAVAPMTAAIAAAPSGMPAQLVACPHGEVSDVYTGSCTPFLVPKSPAAPDAGLCPAGVGGAECGGSAEGEVGAPQPQMPTMAPPGPEQELEEINTPGY